MKNRKSRSKAKLVIDIVRLVKEGQVKESSLETITHEFYITEFDKITYIKATNERDIILEVVNVSYEIKIKDAWVTIWRYDSEHGYMHCHMRISLINTKEAISTARVIKKGTPHKWLTWGNSGYNKELSKV